MAVNPEQTLVLIKPDALKLSLTGYILSQFSEFHTGLRFAATKIVQVTRMLAEEHYAEHNGKPFYPSLLDYITGKIHYADAPQKRRVIAIVYCGPEAVTKIRAICGPTDPHKGRETAPGTLRTLGTVVPITDATGKVISNRIDNLVHASANDLDAEREIKLWFKPNDIMPYMRGYPTVECDAHYYFINHQLHTSHVPGSVCLLAPGDIAWQTDLESLRRLLKGQPAAVSLSSIAAKYLINEKPEPA
ncbi:MAG TPA: nucleoside-diphosphate kinase [Planctomycetota bacterium]|jgi:nucleoside-diphosphate kinase